MRNDKEGRLINEVDRRDKLKYSGQEIRHGRTASCIGVV